METLSPHIYILCVIVTSSILIILYSLVLYRSCKGTSFTFIMTLIVLLLVSNFAAIGTVTLGHFASDLIDDYDGSTISSSDLTLLTKYFNWECVTVCVRDTCLNEAIWLFSFRYWAISFAMPWKLKNIVLPTSFKIMAFSIFLIFGLLNIIFPLLYAYYGLKLNKEINAPDEAASIEAEFHTKFTVCKYMIGSL